MPNSANKVAENDLEPSANSDNHGTPYHNVTPYHVVVGVFAILICLSGFYAGGLSYAKPIFLLTFLLSAIFRRWALAGFLFLLPVFGNRPGTFQVQYLGLVAASLFLGLTIRQMLSRKKLETNNRFIFLGYLYLLVSLFSLSSLPLKKVFLEAFSILPDYKLSTIIYALRSLTTRPETALSYPFNSVLLTAFAIAIAHYIYNFSKNDQKNQKLFSAAILAGLVFSLVIGLIDYYGLIDLRSIRALDPVVNPGNIQFRLQSFFGHSGWYAEYLTLSMPFVLILLSLAWAYKLRVVAIISLLILGEFVLVLTYQRGGWVSYPLTLIVIWAAIYLYRKLELGDTNPLSVVKKSFIKVLISLPLTVVLTFAAVKILGAYGYVQDVDSLNRYVSRFQDISKVSDRTDFIKAGFKIGLLHPIMGAGSESFALQYKKEFAKPTGAYYKEFDHPLHGTSHNVYMQTFSGKGAVGLGLLLLISAGLLHHSFKYALSKKKITKETRLILLIGGSFSAAFLIYGNVQEVFYIQSLQYLFFAGVAIVAASNSENLRVSAKTIKRYKKIILLLFLAHLTWEYALPGKSLSQLTSPQEYGCYSEKKNKHGKTYKWCTTNAAQFIPINKSPGNQSISFTLYAGEFKSRDSTEIEIKSGDYLIEKVSLKSGETKKIVHELQRINYPRKDDSILVSFKSSNYLIPANKDGRKDFRVMAFQLYK